MRKYYIPFALASIIILVLSLIGIFKKDVDYQETTGIIKHIEEEYDPAQEDYEYKVYIDYLVKNKKYQDILYPSYNSSMKVNDEVIVYYDPDDPKLIQAEGYEIVPYITLGASIIALVVTIRGMIKN